MDRGMKKWAPFKALQEQDSFLDKAFKHHLEEDESELMDDSIAQINDILVSYYDEEVEISYFDHTLKKTSGYIDKIDTLNHLIKINGISIAITKIKNIQII